MNQLITVNPNVFGDNRGYFFESYNDATYKEMYGFPENLHFIQDNESCSQKGVIRGLHFQKGDSAQAKLVRVIQGAVLDFAVDIRKNSETFGQVKYEYLTGENKRQFFIPRGFAHGFVSLEDNTIFSYKCDNYYDKSSEGGINMLDPQLNIMDWIGIFLESHKEYSLDLDNLIFSEKDKLHPMFKDSYYFEEE